MRPQRVVTWGELEAAAEALAAGVSACPRLTALYGIPSGGAVVALLLQRALAQRFNKATVMVSAPDHPDVLLVDDICDSGMTRARYPAEHRFAVLHARPASQHVPTYLVAVTEDWLVYPYEKQEVPGEEIITRMLQFLGEDTTREGLRETPRRVARAWRELFGGYRADVTLTTFEDACDEIVVVRDIAFASFCEHHMLPFYGHAHVGYLPAGRVAGLSKLVRVVEKYARRLQVQERMTQQIAGELQDVLRPAGVGVVVEATHLCMVMRGVRQPSSVTVTSAMVGRFRESAPARAEFLALLGRSQGGTR